MATKKPASSQQPTPPKPTPPTTAAKPNYLLFGLLVAGGLLAGFALGRFTAPEPTPAATGDEIMASTDVLELREGGYKYTNPLLECDNYRASKQTQVSVMERELRDYIQQTLSAQKATIVSVYFRDLNNGPWVGINEDENYSPASLLKVPIMIAVLKKCQDNPGLLAEKVLFQQPIDQFGQNIHNENMIEVGKKYTVEDLLFRMIKNSDNEAKNLLLGLIGEQLFEKVVKDLGLIIPGMLTENYMSVRNYSSFFRVMYNATYLNREMSEKALEILSNTNFTEGIVAGVPKGTTVSHKFGERGYADSNIKQLHDCGIVYVAGKPYLLCVMTRGIDFNTQATIIADVSGIVYRNVTKGT